MQNKTMRQILTISFSTLIVGAVSGCSWLYSEDGLIHDPTNDYKKAKQEKPLEVPADYDNSRLKDQYRIADLNIDSNQPELINEPPLQILAVNQGMRINRASEDPGVFMSLSLSELTSNIEAYLKEKEISYQLESNVFTTDWVITDNEAWWRSVFGTDLPRFIRDKYQVTLTEGERAEETALTVKHLAQELMPYDEDVWLNKPLTKRSSTEMLNRFVGHLDYIARLTEAKEVARLNLGIEVKLGQNANKNAALVANSSDFQTVWLKTPKVLQPFGFTLTDKDQITDTYFFNFEVNEPGFFASLFGDDSAVALPLTDGAYQVIIGGKKQGPTTITFIDIDGNPLTDAKMAELFPFLSEGFGRNVRQKKR